ncbi:helix-turn-helix domain-containing protein [Erysipelothrix urinaevulpis]|uniref:helix-turn-helix domain-containing protein n=1 Tax=Erysipelothrix urinaevulpis TaxID=2683717 RepID=UPI001359BC36|nr:Rgg/GadR/MutR family transcriptional regulator [Erysipelothrix urinaevulpis]
MNYSSIYRELRKGKKQTIEEVSRATGYRVSKSFISKFERNESDVSFSRLCLLLDALNISLNEFSFLLDDSHVKDDIDIFLEQVSSSYYKKDGNKLQEIVERERQEYQTTGVYDHLYKSILANVFYCDLHQIKLSDNEIKSLSDYLFGVDYWSKYELIILTNCMTMLPNSIAVTLTDELINKNQLFGGYDENIEVKTLLIFNTMINCINNNKMYLLQKYINELDKMNLDDRFLLAKILTKLFKIIDETNIKGVDFLESEVNKLTSFLNYIGADRLKLLVDEISDNYLVHYSGN